MTYEFVDEPGSRYEFVDEPKSRPLGANAGLANLLAGVAGMPMETVKNVANLGIAGYGTAKGMLGGKNLPELIQSLPGDVANARSMLRQTGVPGLSPDNPSPESKGETLAYDLASRGGMVPGMALGAIGSLAAEKALGPEWSGVGSMLPYAGITAYNEFRAPRLARQETVNARTDQTLAEGRKEGLVVPPSQGGGGWLSKRLEGFGGKAAIGQEASYRNQKTADLMAKKELGLPEKYPLSDQSLENFRRHEAKPYREVAAIDPEAAATLKELSQARFDKNLTYKHYARIPDPEILKKAEALKAKAAQLDEYLVDIAKNAGREDLVSSLKEARTMIAKSYDVERALNDSTGGVIARNFGNALGKDAPLSGNLRTLGAFAEAFPAFTVPGARVPTPGVSKLELPLMALLTGGGYATLGPAGAILGGLPLLSGPTRSMLLSNWYQNMTAPSYTPALRTPQQLPILMQQQLLNEQQ